MKNESEAIYLIIKWLRASGVIVHEHASNLPCCGMYRSETKEIFLNDPGAKSALITICHEAGHWLGYIVFGERKHQYQRERQAFVYGWKVLNMFGANRFISKNDWLQYEKERRSSKDVDTSNVESVLPQKL